jgi:ribosomal protein S3
MGKAKSPRRVGDNEALAVGTSIRGSAQKLNLVAALIRGRKVEEAMNILAFSKRRWPSMSARCSPARSPTPRTTTISMSTRWSSPKQSVGKGLVMKRFHARGRGKSTRILKPFSRLRIVVREQKKWRRKLWVTRATRSVCACRSTVPGTAAGSPRRDYGRLLMEDLKIRKYIIKTLPQAAISKVVIERPAKLCRVSIYAARPGVIIGKKGADIEKLRKQARRDDQLGRELNIVEIRKPEVDAKLVAQGVADQLERRIAFRRAMKRAVQSALRLGAEGIKITCGGRLGGAEIARTEWYREGRVPLHTLRGNVDYAEADRPHRLWRVRHQGLDLQGRNPRP